MNPADDATVSVSALLCNSVNGEPFAWHAVEKLRLFKNSRIVDEADES